MSGDNLDLSKIWLFSTSSGKDLRTIKRALEEVDGAGRPDALRAGHHRA